jgi:hypothetical protein
MIVNIHYVPCIIITPLVIRALNTEQSPTDIKLRVYSNVKQLVNCLFPYGIINNI